MSAARNADQRGVAVSGSSRPVMLEHEVVVLDRVTAAPILKLHADAEPPSDAELFRAEHETPDGSAADPHERRYIPVIIAGLATTGLVIAGASMYYAGGLQAAIVGVVWVLAGYGVAWIVVWGAAMARAREEKEIEERLQRIHTESMTEE